MKQHTKIYLKALKYYPEDFMPSELSGFKGIDIHHVVNRDNRIENLMLLTRDEHLKYGEIKSEMTYLLRAHRKFLRDKNVIFDNSWFEHYINKYSIYDN